MNDCFWSPISYSPTNRDDLSPGSGMIVIPRNWTASFHGAKDFTWGLGVTDPRALLRVTTGWGWNKSFNDNVTLLLDSSIDQLIKNSLFISLKGCSEKNNACNKQSPSNGSCKLYWFTTFDVTKDTETGRHSLTLTILFASWVHPNPANSSWGHLSPSMFTGFYHVFIHPHLMPWKIIHWWLGKLAGITLLDGWNPAPPRMMIIPLFMGF